MLNLPAYTIRVQVIDAIREYFKSRDFLELETPTLISAPSTEPFLEVFETELKLASGVSRRAFLPTSPEFAIKKLLSQGVGNCFEITKSFRNGEEITERHNPEFTILEWYHTPGDYLDVMQDTEALFRHIFRSIFPEFSDDQSFQLKYQGKIYDLSEGWERISVAEAFDRFSGVSIDDLVSDRLIEIGKSKGYQVDANTTWEEIYTQMLLNEIEPKLGTTKPTFLYDYPVSQASFSKKSDADPRFAERFEVYLAGWELGNAFTELTDATEQRARCLEDLAERERLGKLSIPLDEAFLQALEKGIPPTGGIAMGVDRIATLFADAPSIQDVLLFPATEMFDL